MTDRSFEFQASYDDAMIEEAARAFMHRLRKKYGTLLFVACVVNIIGFVLVLVLPGSGLSLTVLVGLIAALGPIYFPWAYHRFPQKFATNMKKGLKPAVQVSLNSSSLGMSANGQSFTKPWTDFKEILEFADYFMFVLNPLAFTFVPKKDTPVAAQQLIRETAHFNASAA